MEQPHQVWHVPLPPQEVHQELQSRVSVANQPECSICFTAYDNVFKTPKQLECTHTFCLECLSRFMVVLLTEHDGNGGRTYLSCPFCRHPTMLPEEGPPALTTNHEVLRNLPSHQQEEEPVWLEGQKLCYKSSGPNAGSGAPDSPTDFSICIDIGPSKTVDPPMQTRQQTNLMDRPTDWKRTLIYIVLIILLVVVVLWPLMCIVNTGSMGGENVLKFVKSGFGYWNTQL
ncbi:RING finger protein 223-like [Parambassis ranga]|uniref:RING finger protein 223-like n=1 Tax=Parambassis ranga TaxID=210632 RepID=A0A6P7IDA0_9TELE|nr:RING finger protein 223-like [Parambassis ranga]